MGLALLTKWTALALLPLAGLALGYRAWRSRSWAQLLREGASLGMATIQRLFLMDAGSLSSGIRLLKAHPPDFVEVLPGLVPKGAARGVIVEVGEDGALAASLHISAMYGRPLREVATDVQRAVTDALLTHTGQTVASDRCARAGHR